MLEALARIEDLQHLLLLGELQRHVRGDGVRQAPGVLYAGERGEHLGRHLLVELHVLLELGDHGAAEHVELALIVSLAIRQQLGVGGVVLAALKAIDAGAVHALHQHLHRAIRQLQQLQDRGDRADAVQVVAFGVVDVRGFLSHQHDALVGAHGGIQRLDGLLPADEQRDDHVRVHHHVAQRQHRHALEAGGIHCGGGFGHAGVLTDETAM